MEEELEGGGTSAVYEVFAESKVFGSSLWRALVPEASGIRLRLKSKFREA